jgi:hypothetical protein
LWVKNLEAEEKGVGGGGDDEEEVTQVHQPLELYLLAGLGPEQLERQVVLIFVRSRNVIPFFYSCTQWHTEEGFHFILLSLSLM